MIERMDPHRYKQEIKRVLDQILECAARLENLLHEERSALELQDAEKLSAITTSKEACVQCMESLDAERQSICTAAGYDTSEAGMNNFLQWCDGDAIVTPLWKRLLNGAKQCEALNRTNGAIGRVRYEHIMSALAVLSGGNNDTQLYDPEGQESAGLQQRPLARV